MGEQRPDLKRSGFYEEMDRHPNLYLELPLYPWHSRLVTLLDLHTPGWTILTGCIKSPPSTTSSSPRWGSLVVASDAAWFGPGRLTSTSGPRGSSW